MIPLSLIHNLSLLATLSLFNGFLMRWFQRRGLRYSLLVGLLFGAATLVGMATPVVHLPGLIFDGRSIVLGIAGFFGGPLVAGMAALMAAAFRIHLGGPGALMGVLVILESSLLGVAGHFLRRRWRGMTGPLPLLGLGLLIHLLMVALMMVLPGGLPVEVFKRLGLIVLVGYPLGFMIVALAFVELERHFRTESALQESEERFRTIFEKGSDGMLMFSAEGEIIDVNEAFARMRGFTRDELKGMSLRELDSPETARHIPERMRRLLAGETLTVELDEIHRDGHRFQVEATASRVYLGERPVILSFHRDITQRKRAEEALRDSEARLRSNEERFRHISSSMMDIAYSCAGREGGGYEVDWMVGATDQLLGRSIEEIMAARCWGGLVLEEDRPLFQQHVIGLAPGESGSCELRLRKRDGSLAWFQSFARCERTGEGGHQLYGALVDITERKLAEDARRSLETQLNQAHKMESLGGLAGGIAHDMNNVLGAILGLATANVDAQPPGSQTRKSFETIIKAAERGGKMVRGLLSFAHQTTVEERTLDLNELLREEVRLLERTTLAKVRLHLDLEADLRPIRGDPASLTHALMNLSINAVDAMPDGGSLTLRTRNLDPGWIEVCVEDTGTGMPKEVLDRAMDPFFTTKEQGKGTGLGLSLVYSAVKAHQGQVAIESEPGRGTCVRLRFPACEPGSMAGEPAVGQRPEPAQEALTILLIDDDELIQASVGMLLEVLGHTVVSASSGEDALRRLDAGLQPGLVILDMNMPGLGGLGTLPRLRALRPELPVLLATGRADQTALDLIEADAHATLLSKPFSMEEMKARIKAEIGKAGSVSGNR